MRWMWIDTITTYEHAKRMVAIKVVSRAEDHLHDHFSADNNLPANPIMPASLMIEGMAQTAGVLVGAANRFSEKVILAKIATAELTSDVVPGEMIQYDATIERLDDNGAATAGIIRVQSPHDSAQSWKDIGRIDLMFSHIDRNLAGLEFPEHNFVFSENFQTILISAGLGELVE